MKNSRLDILSRPLFILALGILLLNDFFLKYEYSNFLTGKLSDFAGLFIFPYFLSTLRIKSTKTIYWFTAFLFTFWKSEFSQEIINWGQSIGIGVNRIVDYTDLLALGILPFSFIYLKKQLETERIVHKALTVPLLFVSLLAIWATTLPRERVDFNVPVNKVFELQISKTDFFNSMEAGHGYSDTLKKNLQDSMFYLHFDIVPSYRADVTVLSTITSIDSNKTQVRLDCVLFAYISGGLFTGVGKDDLNNLKSITAEDFETYFYEYFIKPIRDRKTDYLYYDNKEIEDLYQENEN